MTGSMYPPELLQHIIITLSCDSDCLLVCVFKPKRSDHSMFWDRHPGRAFHRATTSETHHLGFLHPSTLSYCYWHVHRDRSVLRRWNKHHQGSQDPLQSCSRTTGTSLNVFLCQLVWVFALSELCMGIAEYSSLRLFAMMHLKDQVLGKVIGGTFFGLFPTESRTASTLSRHLAVNFRIEPKIDNIPRKNQNGFRRNGSTTSQILTISRILEDVQAKNL